MLDRQALMAKAEDYLRLASEPTTNPVTGALLRILAADYLALAEERFKGQQQQQIQPTEQESKDKE